MEKMQSTMRLTMWVIMLTFLAQCVNAAEQEFVVNNLKFHINDDTKTVTILGTDSLSGGLNIPAYVTDNGNHYCPKKNS